MSAKFKYIKYVGKSAMFGTEVSSIGIKRVDDVVPAVYGDPANPQPGDDASNAYNYSVIKDDDETSYSYESIFKLQLEDSPDNHLSNVRVYLEDGPYNTEQLSSFAPSKLESTNGVATISVTNHNLAIGQTVVITGTNDYNGTYIVSGLNSESFNVFGPSVALIPGLSSVSLSSNTVTVVSVTDHGLLTGNNIDIVTDIIGYNGIHEITLVNSTTFTYPLIATSLGVATGTASKVETTGKVSPILNTLESTNTNIKPRLMIGCSHRFTRPTNNKSTVAFHDLSDTSEDSPYNISVGGISGYAINKDIFQVYEYNVTYGDIGTGNLLYINGYRQRAFPIIKDNQYTMINQVTSEYTVAIYDDNDDIVTDVDIVESIVSGKQVITINATEALLTNYPSGLKYGEISNPDMGGLIIWYDVDVVPGQTIEQEIRIKTSNSGSVRYFIDDIAKPVFEFLQGNTYIFNNISGETHPLRLVNDEAGIADEANVIINGVKIEDGGTNDEKITIVVDEFIQGNPVVYGYESTNAYNAGNRVKYIPNTVIGGYNLNTIGGGTNISAAGESDYIYLQLVVDSNSEPGEFKPNIIIEYDES